MTNFVALPPDGVGKKIRHGLLSDLAVENQQNLPRVGDLLIGATSGASARFLSTYTSIADASITYYVEWSPADGEFTPGENLRNEGNTLVFATFLGATTSVYTPTVHVVDPDNPKNAQKVDDRGAAFATFPEGTPQFDAYGRMQVSQMQVVADYYHVVEDLAGKYWTDTQNGGTVAHDINTSTMVYTTGTQAGSVARRTTNQYHPYRAGVSQLIYITATCGDAGKAGNIREWGYFDDNNGVGFRLNATTLQVFIRSDTSGTPQEMVVNQADWNTNTLDNVIISDFLLDPTKGNVYWIDMEWLGMGEVRLGVLTPDGRRITCHRFENSNQRPFPYTRTATLPMTWQSRNTGVTGSSSELRITSSAVFTESQDLLYTGIALHVNPIDPITIDSDEEYKPFLSFKAKSTVNGKPNTIIGIHETFDWACQGDANLHIGIFVLPSETYLENFKWRADIVPGTMLWVDDEATSFIQYEEWNPKGDFVGSISGNTLTVTSVNSGNIAKDRFITGTGITANTRIVAYGTGTGGTGTYILNKSMTASSTTITNYNPVRPIESFVAPANSAARTALGDRIEKSFGLGGNLNVAETDKGVFVFAAKSLKPATTSTLFYTKYWKEIR